VNDFQRDNDVRRDMSDFNKSCLRMINEMRKVRFEPVSKGF